MEVLRQLEHPLVRDLAWAVFSDDLILAGSVGSSAGSLRSCALSELTPHRLDWLQALDRSPRPLLTHVASSAGQRLGLYFESLWHFFLQADPAAELLAHNLPVREAGRTLGEFDCLYRCRDSGEIVHLELAVKFYLYTGPGSGATGDNRADWLGPGRRDRLDRKLNHLAQHQTRLASHPVAQQLLNQRGLSPARTEVAVKGRLFRRPDQPNRPPTGFNPMQALLNWHYTDTLPTLTGSADDPGYFAILPRQRWLAPIFRRELVSGGVGAESLYSEPRALLTALNERFESVSGPLLVASVDAGLRERQRFFIAPPGWPG